VPQRNYLELSSYDFECLVRDLLAAEWGVRLEVFAPGPDGGVDVRHLSTQGDRLISVQCKHTPGRNWSHIAANLRKESEKLKGKSVGDYWLATSANLTPAAKDKAATLFSDQGLLPERVLGRPDIDSLLDNHPDIEQSNSNFT